MSSFYLWKFLLAISLLAIPGPGFCQPANPVVQAQILVQAGGPQQVINRKLLGQNVLFAGNGMWDVRINDLEPKAAQLITRLRPTVLRFPGGSISNLYIWEDGLGVRTVSPIIVSTKEIALETTPNWTGVTQVRFIDKGNGKYGDIATFAKQTGASLDDVKGFRHTHSSGTAVRPEKRPGQPDWHSNSYGIIEHLKVCETFGAEPLMTVNYGSGLDKNGMITSTASRSQRLRRAAAWVAYLNGNPADNRPMGVDEEGHDWRTIGFWAKKRASLGHPQPYGVKYWEIGNENYNRHEVGFVSAQHYGEDFVLFAQAMKSVDPEIKIGGVGLADPHGRGDADLDSPWNATVLGITKQYLDFLVLHLYYPSASAHPVPYHSRTWFAAVMGAASQAINHLKEIRSLINKSCDRASEIKLIVSEYGLWPADSKSGQDYSNLARALYDADLLLFLVKQGKELGVDLATAWNLHGNNTTAAIRFDFSSESRIIRPQFFVYELLQNYLGRALIPVQVTTPMFLPPQVGNVSLHQDISALQVLATLNPSGRLALWVLNRSLDQDLTTAVTIQQYQPRPTALVSSLNGASLGIHNEANPYQVTVQTKELQGVGPTFQYAFPAHSLTLIEFKEQIPDK
jgi:alpha-L-arabinofuranosidase